MSEDQIAAVADRVAAVLRSHVDGMAAKAVAEAEAAFLGQLTIVQQRLAELEADVRALREAKR